MSSCFSNLLSLQQPGGEGALASTLSPTGRIEVSLIQNSGFNNTGIVKGKVYGFELDSPQVFFPDCFEYNCLENAGLFTTAATSETSQLIGGVLHYWISATMDKQGNGWYVDLATICPATGAFTIVDAKLAIESNLEFTSSKVIGTGLKVAILKKVTASTLTTVDYGYGDYLSEGNLLRSSPANLLAYNAANQSTDLEEIGLGLFTLLNSSYQGDGLANSTVFYVGRSLEPQTEKLIEQNFNRLSRLVDLTSTSARYGSLPQRPATYSESEHLYGAVADRQYNKPEILLFELGCFEVGCFEIVNDATLVSRAVSTRAVAWTAHALMLYIYEFGKVEYQFFLDNLLVYLSNQVKEGLAQEGWTHTLNLADSTVIPANNLSTTVAVMFTLLAASKYTNQPYLLELSTDLYHGVFDYFYSYSTKSFKANLTTTLSSSESRAYAGLFALSTGRIDLLEEIVTSITLRSDYVTTPLTQTAVTNNSLILLPTAPLPLDTAQIQQNLKAALLTLSLLKVSADLDLQVDQRWASIQQALFDFLESNNLSWSPFSLSNCLTQGDLQLKAPFEQLENLVFQKALLLEKLRSMWPIEYSWVSQKALRSGHLGSLLASFAKALALGSTSIHQLREVQLEGQINSGTEEDLRQALNKLDISSSIEEPWQIIQSASVEGRGPYSPVIGESHYSGNTYATSNLVRVKVEQPTPKTLIDQIKSQVGAGIQTNIIENITLETSFEIGNEACLSINSLVDDSILSIYKLYLIS